MRVTLKNDALQRRSIILQQRASPSRYRSILYERPHMISTSPRMTIFYVVETQSFGSPSSERNYCNAARMKRCKNFNRLRIKRECERCLGNYRNISSHSTMRVEFRGNACAAREIVRRRKRRRKLILPVSCVYIHIHILDSPVSSSRPPLF